ncbi:MAG: hypothetical protein KC917_14410, partial [Candidatus Omnitrophica bacterium]|nr:hypothetical protein [Candidatus Omnitrophota bacterium]
LGDSPKMAERFDDSVGSMIRRDRNHPSVVMWGLLNETSDGPVFKHAVSSLPFVRGLDRTRMVMLNSGRFDGQAETIGSLSNPGSEVWENVLSDLHPYRRVPHTAPIIEEFRTMGSEDRHAFISEYGIGSAVDLVQVTRHYEQLGKENVEDARFYRDKLNRFLEDWKAWGMAEVFGRPEDFFAESLRKMAGQRLLGLNAIRSNPHAVGYSLTGTVDQGMSGEGLFTTFRELKPGTVDAVFEGLAPVRWCLFAEPVNLNQGGEVGIEAVLANEDAIQPGNYPVSFEIFDHDNNLVWERHLDFTIPERDSGNEPPLALPALKESVHIDGLPGEYRFVASFDHGAAAAGGQTIFHVYSPLPLPLVENEVMLWGEDPPLSDWLNDHGVKTRAFTPSEQTSREVILTTYPPATPITKETFQELLRHIARGSTAIFLVPDIFKKNSDLVGWLPLAQKGSLATLRGWLYHKDEWVKRHPIFEGLPTGMMDYSVYREVIPDVAWSGQDVPDEVVAGANDASLAYSSGLMLSVYKLGEGRFILNTLRIRENIGTDPVAEKLFANLLSYAAGESDQPLADSHEGFEETLKNLGFGE